MSMEYDYVILYLKFRRVHEVPMGIRSYRPTTT
jgi:hypothetical protein